jgi:hypothetical protein
VRQVFKNFLGDNKDGTGADVLGTVSVFQDDYWVPKQGQLGGVGDGKAPFYSLQKDGKTEPHTTTRMGKCLRCTTVIRFETEKIWRR